MPIAETALVCTDEKEGDMSGTYAELTLDEFLLMACFAHDRVCDLFLSLIFMKICFIFYQVPLLIHMPLRDSPRLKEMVLVQHRYYIL